MGEVSVWDEAEKVIHCELNVRVLLIYQNL